MAKVFETQPCGDQRWTAVGATSSKKRLDNECQYGIMIIESKRVIVTGDNTVVSTFGESPSYSYFATAYRERVLGDI